MNGIRQSLAVVSYNFRQWKKNPRILVTFGLAFVLCFLLTDKAVQFAEAHGTPMQMFEPFIWTFGDSNSILLISLLLILLFADMPFLSSGTPLFLVRMNRRRWITGQLLYTILATTVFLLFILLPTMVLCVRVSFVGNIWSQTAAILAYSGVGQEIALPALVKTLELSYPYQCAGTIFCLMLCYALVLVFLMMSFTLRKGSAAGIVSGFAFCVYGLLMKPATIATLFHLPDVIYYKANVAVGWLSPLNQATYHMHNFGYDRLPRLWQSFLIFGLLLLVGFLLAQRGIRRYHFIFTGTEG
jgi:hypothetical protein